MPGFGHPLHHPVDQRAERILELASGRRVAIISTYGARPFVAGATLDAFNEMRLRHTPVGTLPRSEYKSKLIDRSYRMSRRSGIGMGGKRLWPGNVVPNAVDAKTRPAPNQTIGKPRRRVRRAAPAQRASCASPALRVVQIDQTVTNCWLFTASRKP